MQAEALNQLVLETLDDMKGKDVVSMDVRELTSVADTMVVVTGTSSRHVKSMADELIKKAKEAGHTPRGVEGQEQGDWVLLDLGDVIVHLMLAQVRQLYDLESLWSMAASRGE